ncbi:hypothetical protein DFJ73DRAFT_849954 [Zopfochytrium polystomum]|nr:hypothetical protein DFJ73DRAFT_849954 [Zopfochytrium polystomum]
MNPSRSGSGFFNRQGGPQGGGGGGGSGGSALGASGIMDDPSMLRQYTFKLRDLDTGRVHRLVVAPPTSLEALTQQVLQKLGPNHPRFPTTQQSAHPVQDLALSYIDDEGDTVHLGSDEDLIEALTLARGLGWSRLMICMDAQIAGASGASGMGRFLWVGGGGSSHASGSIASNSSGTIVGHTVAPNSGGGALLAHQLQLQQQQHLLMSAADSTLGRCSTKDLQFITRSSRSSIGISILGRANVFGTSPLPPGLHSGVIPPAKDQPRSRRREVDGFLAPMLIGTGVALVCAFLLGRAFK